MRHRPIRGANLYRDGPVDYLVTKPMDGDYAAAAIQLGVTADSLGNLISETAKRLLAGTELPAWTDHWADEHQHVVVEMADERTVHTALGLAAELAQRAMQGDSTDVAAAESKVLEVFEDHDGDGSLLALARAARQRGIPVDERDERHLQLGWGIRQKNMLGTLTSDVSALGFDIARDHERSKFFLEPRGIPMPDVDSARTLAGVTEIAQRFRYPVVLKPLRGAGAVTPNIQNEAELETAYDAVKEISRWVVVEEHIPGICHTVLTVGGKVVAAKTQAGDDVTDTLHPAVRLTAERCARLCNVDLLAVEMVAENLELPLEESGGKVVGLNPEPDLAGYPDHRHVPDAVLDQLFPEDNGRIPLVAVTGTNGKTTTVRLVSHFIKYSGGRVGMACTGAVEVENRVILRGDYSGPIAARTVLREPGVTHAVCEVARGGLLRSGLGFDRCDVGIFLNVGSDHLGEGGILTVDDLARLKSVVIRAVGEDGTAVLNADDERVWAVREQLRCNVIPFSMDPDHPGLKHHLGAHRENAAVTVAHGAIVLRRGSAEFRVANIVDIPITLEGAALFNVENAMAAVAAAYALGLSEEDTRAGLISFNPSFGQLPGRMNVMELGGVKVLVDYGHNVPALEALAEVLPRLAPGRKINVANASGNRGDEQLFAFGKTVASMYDRIFLCDPDPRGRDAGETAGIIANGIREAGFPDDELVLVMDEQRAFRLALADAKPGDLVVLQADNIGAAIQLCQDLQNRLGAGESPAALNDELLAN